MILLFIYNITFIMTVCVDDLSFVLSGFSCCNLYYLSCLYKVMGEESSIYILFLPYVYTCITDFILNITFSKESV